MTEAKDGYIRALRFRWLTRFYDPVVAATTREKTFKRRLIEQAELGATQRVLDLGCGTGTLAILAKQMCPHARVTGCDGDPQVLSRARQKADLAGVQIQLDRALSYSLPYGDAGFDRVLSSLFFHHLLPADKERTLREVVRVLRPGGELHVCDWGRPSSPLMRVLFLGVQLLDGFASACTAPASPARRVVAQRPFGGERRRFELGFHRSARGASAWMSSRRPSPVIWSGSSGQIRFAAVETRIRTCYSRALWSR